MVPARLTLRNFLCYRGACPPLELEHVRVACLTGDNGNGKSALLDAMTWALWGKARGKGDGDLVTLGQTEMEVEFEFFAGEGRFRVVRKYRRAGSRGQGKSDVFFFQHNSDQWRNLSGNSVSETQRRIDDVLKLSYETFINSAFLMQGRADEFTNKSPGARKEVLAEILNLDIYDHFEECAKERRNERRQQVQALEQRLIDDERELEALPRRRAELAEIQDALADAETEHAAARDRLATLRQRETELRTLREQQTKIETSLQQRRAEVTDVEGSIAVRQADIARHEEVLARADAIRAGYTRLQDMHAQLQQLESEHNSLEGRLADARERRDAARRELDETEKQATAQRERIASLTTEIAQGDTIRAGYQRLLAARTVVAEQSRRLAAHAEVEKRLVQLRAAVDGAEREVRRTIEAKQTEAARLREQAGALAARIALRDAIAREQAELDVLEGQLRTAREEASEAQASIQSLQSRNTSLTEEITELHRKFEELKAAVQREEAHCPLCRSNLGHEGLKRVEETYQAEGKRKQDERRANKLTIEQLESTVQARTAEARRLGEELTRRRDDWKARQERAQRAVEEAQTAADTLPALESECARLAALLAGGEVAATERAAITKLEQELATIGYDADALEAARRQEAACLPFETRHDALQRAESELTTARSLLDATEQAAAAAQRRLDDEEAAIVAFEKRLAALPLAALRGQAAELEGFAAAFQELRDAESQLPLMRDALATERARLEALRGRVQAEEEQLRGLAERIGGLAGVEQELGPAAASEQQLAQRCRDLHSAVGACRQQIEMLEETARQTHVRRAQLDAAKREQAIYEELTRAFGKQGVQAMIIDSVLGEVETTANELLARMTNNRMHVTLETQRETQKGTVRETLDIKIADEWGTRAYELFSGGEAFRINLALRIALSKLLARRAGAPLPTLVIDEGFGTQDAAARERLVEALNAIQDEFQCLLIVTHLDDLKDLFETRIEVVKNGDGSVARVVAA